MSYEFELKKIGLTSDQAKIYEVLVKSPALPARLISKKSGISREMTYLVLGQLISSGLAEKISGSGKIAFFRAIHPSETTRLVSEKESEARSAKEAFGKIIQQMIGDYNNAHNRPHVRFFDGIEGLKNAYNEILTDGKPVYILRSFLDHKNKDTSTIIHEQIIKQSRSGIHSYVLSPKLPHMSEIPYKHNLERNITRKILPKETFSLPAQVMIFGNKASITSFDGNMITTLIDSKEIAQTFRTLFDYLWNSA